VVIGIVWVFEESGCRGNQSAARAEIIVRLTCGSIFEFFEPVAELVAGNTQQFRGSGLVAVAAIERLSHKGHLYLV